VRKYSQPRHNIILITNGTTMSNEDTGSSNASEDDGVFEEPRPNRWQGAPSTWQSLTEAERGLAASLDKIRNQDLSVHLFNAYALKRRSEEKDVSLSSRLPHN